MTYRQQYFPHLNLLRVFFIFIVLIHHWVSENPFIFLPFGTTIAFVLSAFLLSYPLLEAKQKNVNYWDFVIVFIKRRWLRTLPLYFLVLLIYLIFNRHGIRDYYLSFLTFTQNYLLANNTANKPFAFSQTWSLAVQEQFYLTLPLIIFFFSYRQLKLLFVLFAIFGLIIRLQYFYTDRLFSYNHFSTECCIDCFGIGALISIIHLEQPEQLKRISGNKTLFICLLVLYFISMLGYFKENNGHGKMLVDVINNLYRITERTFVSLLSVWFIAWGIYYPSDLLTKISTHKTIKYLSKISYGIYIFHFIAASIVLKLLQIVNPDISQFAWWVIVLNYLLSISIAAISYHFFERPISSFKNNYFIASGEKIN